MTNYSEIDKARKKIMLETGEDFISFNDPRIAAMFPDLHHDEPEPKGAPGTIPHSLNFGGISIKDYHSRLNTQAYLLTRRN